MIINKCISVNTSLSTFDCVAVCSVTCSKEPEDDEQLKAPVVNSLPTVDEMLNTEGQDMGSFNACTQGDADPQNLEVNEQTSKSQDPCQSEKGKKDQQPVRSPEQAVEVKKKITYAKLLKEGRRFNIDLVSKVSVHLINETLHIYIKFQISDYTS